jgi:hypothetical protein
MRTFAQGTRTLLLGTLFLVSFFVTSPLTANAAVVLGTQGQKTVIAAGKTIADVTEVDCLSGQPSLAQTPSNVPETIAEATGGSCVILYKDGTKSNLLFSPNTVQAAQTNAAGAVTMSAPTADPNAGGGGVGGQSSGRTTGNGCTADFRTWGTCLINATATFFLTITGSLLGTVGVLLNWIVVKTVFQFSQLVGNSAGLLAAWGVLRDIGNLLLLFGFVLMGIGTILDTSKLPDKKAIPKLIVFAVLLNFSIFASEAVIDTANVLTSVMYSQANTNPCVTETCDINTGIAGKIMESTGLSGIYDLKSKAPTNELVTIIGLTIFSVVGIVVLLAVILTGLIIVSPIGFAGMALQPFEKMAKAWWSKLLHEAFFAPILFLLIFITLRVTDSFAGGAANNNSLATALGGGGVDHMGIIMVFVIVCGGMIASLMAAKKFGADGADFAVNSATRVVFGGTGMVLRNTVGAGSADLSRRIRSSSIGSSVFGRSLANITDKGANSSFSPLGTKAFATLAKSTKLDIAKPDKRVQKGFAGIEKEKTEALAKYGNSLTPSKTETARKEVLEKEIKAAKESTETNIKQLAARRKTRIDEQTVATNAWSTKEKDDDAKIGALETKVSENEGNVQVTALDRQIAAEKLNGQRLMSTGKIGAETEVSAARVKELETKRDEYIAAGQKLNELRATKTTEQAAHAETIKRIQTDIQTIDTASEKSRQDYETQLEATKVELEKINPKQRYAKTLENFSKLPIIGGRVHSEAAKKIKTDMKKTKGQKGIDDLKAALKDNKDTTEINAKLDAALPGVNDNEEEDLKLAV